MNNLNKTALDRLNEYLQIKKIPVGRLEKMAGLANGYIRNNKGSLSSNKLADILSVLSDLNGHWLLTGRGNMLLNGNHESSSDIKVEDTSINGPEEESIGNINDSLSSDFPTDYHSLLRGYADLKDKLNQEKAKSASLVAENHELYRRYCNLNEDVVKVLMEYVKKNIR